MGGCKVPGASVPALSRLLSAHDVRLVLLANGIAWLLASGYGGQWLQQLAYRFD